MYMQPDAVPACNLTLSCNCKTKQTATTALIALAYFYVSSKWNNYVNELQQARKLQATLVPVRNYHRPTYSLADGGEV